MARTKTNPAVLSARRKMRESLKRENERVEQEARSSAAEALMFRKSVTSEDFAVRKRRNGVIHATIQLASAVAKSMNVNVPIMVEVSYDNKTTASTDFQSITIKLNPSAYDINDYKSVARLLKFVKGVLYHEIGHCKFTVPFLNLKDLSSTLTGAGEDFGLFKAWNILEDQRMECAMVRYSPIMRNYFTIAISDHVVSKPETAWPWVAGRTYLSKELLDSYRKEASKYATEMLFDPDLVRDTSRVVAAYKRATDPEVMGQAIIDMLSIVERWQRGGMSVPANGGDQHEQRKDRNSGVDEMENRINESAEQKQDDNAAGNDVDDMDGTEPTGDAESSSDKDDPATEQPPQDVSSSDSDSDSDSTTPSDSQESEETGEPSGSQASTKSPQDILDKEKERSFETDNRDEQDAKEFMSVVNEEERNELPHYTKVSVLDDEQLRDAEDIKNGMLITLEPLAVQIEPSWRFRQEQGVLDPVSFMIREAGDTDFWTDLDDSGKDGFDLSVSVILDVSYSMGDDCYDLGSVVYGIRNACDELTIPCTVSVFDDTSYRLWNHDEETLPVWAVSNGGTDPSTVLRDLDNQDAGKTKHLVIILTDGFWPKSIRNMNPYSKPGRYLIGVTFSKDNYPYANHLKENLAKMNFDEALGITKVTQLPEVVSSAISGYFA